MHVMRDLPLRWSGCRLAAHCHIPSQQKIASLSNTLLPSPAAIKPIKHNVHNTTIKLTQISSEQCTLYTHFGLLLPTNGL